MFTGNKAMIMRECERRNSVRRVCDGTVDHTTFFHNIRGDLLISGYIAANTTLLANMITEYMKRGDMPTIVLSGHNELFEFLRQRQSAGEINRVMISDPTDRNYHPFYGMNAQKLLHFVHLAAEAQGFSLLMDQVLQYAAAALNIVSASYPMSLPAFTKLLKNDDDFISAYALQLGLSNVIADIIRGNHEAGVILRRALEKLEEVFEDVYDGEKDTKYNFQSGAQGDVAVMAFYSVSADQKILNSYLKEELFFTLKRVPKIRVIVDEMEVDNVEEDELVKFLFQMKRQGKVELIFVSKNAGESAGSMQINFSNVVLSTHEEPAVMENLTKALWGTYQYSFPAPAAGAPPALFFSFKTTVHWGIATEERLRVRAVDLYGQQGVFRRSSDLLALKTTANDNIYLVSSSRFLPTGAQLPAVSGIGW
jgi:hypothetical protein